MVIMLLHIDNDMYKDYVVMEKRRNGHVHGAAQGSELYITRCLIVLAKAVQAVD